MPSRRGGCLGPFNPWPLCIRPLLRAPGARGELEKRWHGGGCGGVPVYLPPGGLSATMRLGARERLRGGIILEHFLLQPIGQSSPVSVGGG